MSLRSRRLSRKRKHRPPPPGQLLAEAAQLRELAPDDRDATVLCDAVEAAIRDGFIVRASGLPDPKPAPLHEAWGGKEPPERP
jgi:hypothetical protein